MPKYLKYIPRALQEDFIDNKVIPLVGAGFSKNANLPHGLSIPDWNELGQQVAEYIPDYEYTNVLDTLSLFESQFSKVKLIELLAKILHINDLMPGEAHRSFCNVFFDTICTTNFDFLIEHTLQETGRPHSIIVSEDRLPINTYEKTKLVKLHGDLNHPERMIITEHDYDTYLDKNKVLSTYISNLFITRTLFLVGYSFTDTDIRSLWQIINSRLGQLRRPAYTVMIDASPIDISRFERRNIKVINLKGKKTDYHSILNQFFIEIKELIDEQSPNKITATTEKAREELKLPQDNKRLCFISAPYTRISFLKELIYPILDDNNITPITLNEVIMPGDNWMAKSETLLKESSFAIIDVSGNNINVMWEFNIIMSLHKKFIIIADEEHKSMPQTFNNFEYLIYNTNDSNETFILQLNKKLSKLIRPDFFDEEEPNRLLQKNEYDAAVISAFRLLESSLRKYSGFSMEGTIPPAPTSLSKMLLNLKRSNLPQDLVTQVIDYLNIRNQIVHTTTNINKKTAKNIVELINKLVQIINTDGINFNKM